MTAGRSTTFTTGVIIGGFSVSAQSGWNSETSVVDGHGPDAPVRQHESRPGQLAETEARRG